VDYTGDKYKQLSTLCFSYTFEYPDDIVYFAHFVPYTYSHLEEFLYGVQRNHSDIARVDALARTLGGNICYVVTVSNDLESTHFPTSEDEADSFHYYLGRKSKKQKQHRKHQNNKRHVN